jgi:hypothetical protein
MTAVVHVPSLPPPLASPQPLLGLPWHFGGEEELGGRVRWRQAVAEEAAEGGAGRRLAGDAVYRSLGGPAPSLLGKQAADLQAVMGKNAAIKSAFMPVGARLPKAGR